MTNLSEKEFDDYIRKYIPIMYHGNGVTMGADLELRCWYFHTIKYQVEWFWAGKTLQVTGLYSSFCKLFSSPICGDLSILCHIDDGVVLYCDAEMVDSFVDRLLGMRCFL